MDLATCLKKMQLVGVLAFATVDTDGAPQIRNISAIHYEEDAIYFLQQEGKISAGSFNRMAECRFFVIPDIRK